MPLQEPPAPVRLRRLPAYRIAGRTLHRVHLRSRRSPWRFSSADAERAASGRFDLPAPDGSCYLATSPVAAVLEAFQDFGEGQLPDVELRKRVRAQVNAPDTPDAAWLSAARARGFGVTAALWAGSDRALTQRWAAALRRAGWSALLAGIQHDPSGRLRSVTLFDEAGEHPPYGDTDGWRHTAHTLHDDWTLRARLSEYGIEVTRSDPNLPVVSLDQWRRSRRRT